MSVALLVEKTIGGGAVADALAGGGTGVDLTSVVNSAYAPLVNQTNNQGAQDLYISHDAVTDPITAVKSFFQQYGVGTGFGYGGAKTAAQDRTDLITLGQASGSSKNNGDGLSGGLWIDMDWDSNDTTRFDQASFPAVVKIYGDAGTDGVDLASAFPISTQGMVYDAPGETSASAPVAGQIGKANDTVLGEYFHGKWRLFIPSSWPDGGVVQLELVFAFSFTA